MKKAATLGRDPSSDIPIADDSISWKHAEIIKKRNGHLFITDCNSRNGIFLLQSDGVRKKVRSATISGKDKVVFGECEMTGQLLLQMLSQPAPQQKQSPPSDESLGDWLRCDCGEVKRERQKCPVCGE